MALLASDDEQTEVIATSASKLLRCFQPADSWLSFTVQTFVNIPDSDEGHYAAKNFVTLAVIQLFSLTDVTHVHPYKCVFA